MRVEITNLAEFANVGFGGLPRYRTQLEILSDLMILASASADDTILVDYKDDGHAVFDIVRITNGTAYYQFATTAS